MSFKPPQPILFTELTLGMVVGHAWYTPTIGIEGEVKRIDWLHRRALIKFHHDPYLAGYTWWYQWEIEKFIFYLGDRWDSYQNIEELDLFLTTILYLKKLKESNLCKYGLYLSASLYKILVNIKNSSRTPLTNTLE